MVKYLNMTKNIYPGKFIVFEGLDGSGQSTQAGKLADYLNQKEQKLKFGHIGVHLTKEPTSGLIGGLIKSQLNHDWKSSAECLQLLFAADRAYHLEKEIIPLLKRGVTVVCDRYFFSSFAYGALESDQNWLFQINDRFLSPDITIFLKVSPRVCIERISKTRWETTLFEKEKLLEKVFKNYMKLTPKFKNIYVIDGEQPIEKVFQDVIKICEKHC